MCCKIVTTWTSMVKMSMIISAVTRAGIYPVNRVVVGKRGTLDPAKLYCESSSTSESDQSSTKVDHGIGASSSLEAVMEPSTVLRFNERHSEGFDIEGDELYSLWVQLKKHTISI